MSDDLQLVILPDGEPGNNKEIKVEDKINNPTQVNNTETIMPEKRKRGRPKGVKNKDKTTELNPNNGEDSNISLNISEYKPDNTEPPGSVNTAQYISGSLLIMVINLVIPNILVFLIKRYKKKSKITAKHIRLNKEEKDELIDLADEAAKHMSMHLNPVTLFFVAIGTTYLAKAYTILDSEPETKEKNGSD